MFYNHATTAMIFVDRKYRSRRYHQSQQRATVDVHPCCHSRILSGVILCAITIAIALGLGLGLGLTNPPDVVVVVADALASDRYEACTDDTAGSDCDVIVDRFLFCNSSSSVSTLGSVFLCSEDNSTWVLYNVTDATTTTTVEDATTAPAVATQLCFTLIGFDDTNVCWNGTDYCSYPLELDGLNGTLAYSLSDVSAFVGDGYTLDTDTGCWNITSVKRDIRPAGSIRTGLPSTYMIFTSTPASLVTYIPLAGYGQTTYASSNVDIDWGDGTIEHHLVSSVGVVYSHTYGVNDTDAHTIRIAGTAHALCYTSLASANVGKLGVISQWGNVVTYQMNFYDELRLGSLVVTATDGPNPSLVNIHLLFAVASGLTTVGKYASRVETFAAWSLPNVVTGTSAFGGLNMTTGAVLPSTLVNAASMYVYAIMPTDVTLSGMTLATSDSMFYYASFAGTVTMDGVTTSSATNMFSRATITGDVLIHNSALVSPANMFFVTTLSGEFSMPGTTTLTGSAASMFNGALFLGSVLDMSDLHVAAITSASSMFLGMRVAGNYTSPGVFSAATSAFALYNGARCYVAPCTQWNMTALSLPVATDVRNAFTIGPTATRFSNIPNLSLAQATLCNSMFTADFTGNYLTIGERFVPIWPDMKCTDATKMFRTLTLSQGADFSGMNVSRVVTATSMFLSSVHQGANATIFPGPFPAATTTTSMFQSTTYVTAPDMTLISIPVAVTATSMFASCNKVTAMPNLNPVSVVTGTSMFNLATMAEDMGTSSLSWTFPALQTATSMFAGTNFASYPFYMHTWGMGEVRTLLNFANTAANVPSTIDVSPWQMQQLTTLSGFFYGVNSPSLILNLTLWSTPRLTTMTSAFANLVNVQLVGVHNLDVSRVTNMQTIFSLTPLTANIVLNTWNTSSLTIATGAFQTCIGTSVDISTWDTSSLSVAGTMFQTTNVDPDMTSWSWASIVSANSILDQCFLSTTNRYSQVLIAFADRSNSISSVTLGGPRSNLLTSTGNLPTRILRGYDGTGNSSRATLITRSWVLSDGGYVE